jgi:succinate dehydrogenase/fumarate reductase flavoprotein subunit
MISIDEQIAYQREPWGSGEHEVAILATLQSIKDAGDAVVEPEYLIRLRNALKGFKSDGAFAGDKDIVDYIDSLQSALKVAQQERDEKRLQWQNWRSRMGLTASATELLERAEKAEASNKRLVELLRAAEPDVSEIYERMQAEGWHRKERMEFQTKLIADIAELLREAGK